MNRVCLLFAVFLVSRILMVLGLWFMLLRVMAVLVLLSALAFIWCRVRGRLAVVVRVRLILV